MTPKLRIFYRISVERGQIQGPLKIRNFHPPLIFGDLNAPYPGLQLVNVVMVRFQILIFEEDAIVKDHAEPGYLNFKRLLDLRESTAVPWWSKPFAAVSCSLLQFSERGQCRRGRSEIPHFPIAVACLCPRRIGGKRQKTKKSEEYEEKRKSEEKKRKKIPTPSTPTPLRTSQSFLQSTRGAMAATAKTGHRKLLQTCCIASPRAVNAPPNVRGTPWRHKPALLNGRFGNCKIGGCKETRQPFANLSPTLRQPFLPTPLQAPLSVDPRRRFRNAGSRLLRRLCQSPGRKSRSSTN